MFALAKRLFDVDIVPADGEAPVWDESARFFKVVKVRCSLDTLHSSAACTRSYDLECMTCKWPC